MKTLKNLLTLLMFGSFLMINTSCDDDDPKDNPPAPTTKELSLKVKYGFDGGNFALNQDYVLPGKTNAVNITAAQFYLDEVMFTDMGGNITDDFSNQEMFFSPSRTTYDLGTTSSSHLHMINMLVGIDSTTNATVRPSDFSDINEPLAPQSPTMYWSWNSGYIFLKIEGNLDADGDGITETDFAYHVGLNNFAREGSLMLHKDISNGNNEIMLHFDVAKIFDGLDLTVDHKTHTMDNMPLASKVADNWLAAFSM